MKRAAALLLAILLAGCANSAPKQEPPPVAVAPEPTPQVPPPPPPPPPEPAPPRLLVEPNQVLQGDVATLRLDQPVSGDLTVKVTGLNEQPRVYRLNGRPVAFVGFPANARIGPYPVTVTWEGGELQATIEVVRKKFTEDRLVVTAEQEATYYDPRQADEWARVFERRSHSLPRPRWEGAFQLPLEEPLKITTYFGEIRFVNGVETGRHSGMDFGAPEGTPIMAPAPGVVVLAETLIVSGQTIIIDHGLNLYTAYYHCSGIDVKPGDWVATGQVIGRVGNTGFSLGDHLHWTATIGNTPVDPWPLTQAAPLGVRAPGPDRQD